METEKKVFEPKRNPAARTLPWRKLLLAAVALLLVVALTVGLILAFRPRELVVSYEGVGLDAEMYALWYTILKNRFMMSNSLTSRHDTAETWDKPCPLEGYEDKTWGEVLDAKIREAIKLRLVAAVLYDEMGFTLTSGQRNRIKSYYSNMVEYKADGDAGEMKRILERYSSSPSAAERCAVLDMKVDLLYYQLALGGTEYLSTEEINGYYRENYSRVKIVYINNEYYREYVNGKWVNLPLDTSVVGPGAQNSEDLATLDGYYFSEEGIPGTYAERVTAFEKLLSRSDEGLHTANAYPSGIYLDGRTDYSIGGLLEEEVASVLLSDPPAPGKLRRVETEDGVRFIMGYEIDGGAYNREESKVFFTKFFERIAEKAIATRARERFAEVKVDMGEHKLDVYTIPYNDKNLAFCVVD